MRITRQSQLTGKWHTKDLDVTDEQIMKHNTGTLLQNAFPDLNREDREFIKSGITGEEWTNAFGNPPEPTYEDKAQLAWLQNNTKL